jgi:activator of HSP90 ATPase
MTPIQYTVRFNATARELYDLYIKPELHAAFTGAPVKIGARTGSRFSAFGGQIWGVMLFADPGRMIVQRWRSTHFLEADTDSILILTFTQESNRGRIDLQHLNVPKQDHAGVTNGWEKYYWKPMHAFLKHRHAR